MRALIWRPEARRQYLEALDYIAQRNLNAAERLNRTIVDQVDLLRHHPFIGRLGRIADTRELVVHPNYIIIYRVDETDVKILRFLHARQKYP
jgi:addiction module RelE/StbE family toxin